MNVIVAKSAGFCYGVSRAVELCKKTADEHKKCLTLGPIIHNEHVINDLEKIGVHAVNDVSEVSEGSIVVIRSHGAGKSDYEALEALSCNIIDATCPDVKKIHDIVRNESNNGRLIFIIGEKDHPEVSAIAGWCKNYEIFQSNTELSECLNTSNYTDIPTSVVFQTTSTNDEYNLCCNIIKKECTNIKIFDTICNATCRRQQEAVEISQKADAVFVVGDKSSSNSVKLADICKQHSANVYFVQSAEDLNLKELSKYNVIGVTAGASTPASIIKEVTQKMSKEEIMDGTNTEDETIVEVVEDIQPEPEEVEVKITETPVEEKVEVINEPAVADEVVIETSIEEPATEPEAVVETTVEVVEDDEPAKDESDSDEETFEQMLEKSIKTIRTGERVTGVVTSITPTEVSLDLGTKQSGYIPIAELTDDENTDINDIIKIGDTIESFVMRVNDVEGMVMLSKKRFDAVRNWDYVEAAKDDKTIVSGVVIGENKGGIVVNVKGVHVFVPASQTGLPKTASMSELLKKPVKLRITEVNKSRRRVVGSIRMIQHDERREKTDKVWTDIEVGKQYDGIVKSMTTYGVFVDIGGVDGMIHISELSWTRIKQPSEVMSVGDEVSVYVISFDKDSRKISLGYKKGDDNPWTKFTSKYAIGDVISVKIVKMMPFGAFAEICPGVDGLIHISQIADHRIGLPSEVLSDGQIVDVKITEIDNERKKVSLSIRALLEATQQSPTTEEKAEEAEESKEAEETEKTEEAKESPQE